MKYICSLFLLGIAHTVIAQQDTLNYTSDGIYKTLTPVTVTAYGQLRLLQAVPAAINYISNEQLGRYSNTSVLEAVNATPGVRMEERSPGSYRLNIRGSSLRSPFGVRNVKVYYNDIPLTDPSGFTYFNQLGFFNINSLQIIKGPGSSQYGAGTGGVMLINSLTNDTGNQVTMMYEGGSYGINNIAAEAVLGKNDNKSIVRYQHQSSDGYRAQSASVRDVASWDGAMKRAGNVTLEGHFLYNKLNYQTPGALTLAEYNADPTAARPHTAAALGAEEAHAQIFQQNVLAGMTAGYRFNSNFMNTTTVYGSYTQLNNPTIRNYTRSNEPHFGGRTTFRYDARINKSRLTLIAGAETQSGYVLARTYTNATGIPGTLQSDDEVKSTQTSVFAQATLQTGRWMLEAGNSFNMAATDITRLAVPASYQARNYPMQLSPRVAASYYIYGGIYLYANVAKGFSPPASTELLPTGGTLNTNLTAETGWNYEAGTKGDVFYRRLHYDASVFYYMLNNAIVLRKDAAGGDEYINAGSTQQPGLEASLNYSFRHRYHVVSLQDAWASYSLYDFKYKDFMQGATDISGKQLPGVAPNTLAMGADVQLARYFTITASCFFSDRIALNDANTAYSSAYHIADLKITFANIYKRAFYKLFAGANNLLSEKYSLGNDINAAGGRYYNAAPGRNYYAGIALGYK